MSKERNNVIHEHDDHDEIRGRDYVHDSDHDHDCDHDHVHDCDHDHDYGHGHALHVPHHGKRPIQSNSQLILQLK